MAIFRYSRESSHGFVSPSRVVLTSVNTPRRDPSPLGQTRRKRQGSGSDYFVEPARGCSVAVGEPEAGHAGRPSGQRDGPLLGNAPGTGRSVRLPRPLVSDVLLCPDDDCSLRPSRREFKVRGRSQHQTRTPTRLSLAFRFRRPSSMSNGETAMKFTPGTTTRAIGIVAWVPTETPRFSSSGASSPRSASSNRDARVRESATTTTATCPTILEGWKAVLLLLLVDWADGW